MSARETVLGLSAFPRRGAGTDAERRAADWLADELAGSRRTVTVETFWCRPNWAWAQAWHVALALAGAVLMVSHATIGGALALVALACTALDATTARSPGRRLTPEHASQNVIGDPAGAGGGAGGLPGDGAATVGLIVTAPYDAGRTGIVYARPLRTLAAWGRRHAAGGRLALGWLGWIALAIAALVAVAIARRAGAAGTPIAVVQLVPSVALVAALAGLLALGGSPFGPAANDDASGVAVAIALVRALDAAPPRHLRVQLVLTGAGDGDGTGLRHHLRAHRPRRRAEPVVVLGIAAAGAGAPRWWVSDGPLWPLRYHPRLRVLAARAAADQADADDQTGAGAHRGRGAGPALTARLAGLPALSLGALDTRGLAPRSHRRDDLPDAVDAAAMDRVLELALMLVDALDADQRPAAPAGDAAVAPIDSGG